MMYIRDILYFDKRDREAEAIVSDGVHSVICYACPIDTVEKGTRLEKLFAFSCTSIERAAARNCPVTKLPQHYAYALTARVYSKKEGLADVGELRIELDERIPNDISDGEYISFCAQRLDMI